MRIKQVLVYYIPSFSFFIKYRILIKVKDISGKEKLMCGKYKYF